ncbi:DUF1657 domain-containing protein [Aquibacillus albus]|uniref:DUF1657 domain-containing protein n=1 Tax=Aquibacillus albus TaxID=1168171 RepID=A0ABS2N226_9BACI|nr:DUF1657 domain-containing protein [Aquibacillus albus]MBM7572186.1 hypothetical protein [Aquibacillus albus]
MTVASQVKQSLASLKGVQTSLSSLSTRTQSEEAKKTFQEGIELIDQVKKDLINRVGELEREEEQYKGI